MDIKQWGVNYRALCLYIMSRLLAIRKPRGDSIAFSECIILPAVLTPLGNDTLTDIRSIHAALGHDHYAPHICLSPGKVAKRLRKMGYDDHAVAGKLNSLELMVKTAGYYTTDKKDSIIRKIDMTRKELKA